MAELIEATTDDGINWKAAEALAADGPQDQAPGQGGPQQAPGLTPGQELSGMLQALAMVVRPALPSVAAIYDKATCDAIGAGVDPVCAKYGWLQGGFQWAAELQALIVVVPIVMATSQALKHDVKVLKEAKAAREAEAKAARERKPAESVPDA